MMDKRTIVIMVVCLLILVGGNYVANWIFPPIPKRPTPATPTHAVSNVVATVAAATATNEPTVSSPAPPTTPAERPPEQIVVLSNDYLRVEFTSWGGGIRKVELLRHKANGHGHVVLNADAPAPSLGLTGVPGADTNAVFTLEPSSPTTMVMRAGQVTKTVSLGKDYLLDARIEGVNASSASVVVGTVGPTFAKEPPLYLNVDWQDGPKWNNRDLNAVTKRAGKGQNHEPIHARWVAVKSQYFAMVLTGATNATAVTYAPVVLPPLADWKAKEPPHGVTALAQWPTSVGGVLTFQLYAGPKEYDRLAALGERQQEVMDFGSWMDAYSGLFGLALFKGMAWCHKLAPNYGVAIILVTILLKIIFWPIQAKSIQAMKDMQKFQPQMQKIREKFKDDPQRMNQEMMKLYKEHKINPFSGCLPMLVQLPVLFGFYKVLSNAIELRGVPFLWIKDLSQPDTVATIAGFAINPLPVVMTLTMIWQQKLTPSTGDAQQQKMMMFMPLIMLFFFYSTASGLVLYWTAQQFLSIGQQWWSMRQATPPAPVPAPKAKK